MYESDFWSLWTDYDVITPYLFDETDLKMSDPFNSQYCTYYLKNKIK